MAKQNNETPGKTCYVIYQKHNKNLFEKWDGQGAILKRWMAKGNKIKTM